MIKKILTNLFSSNRENAKLKIKCEELQNKIDSLELERGYILDMTHIFSNRQAIYLIQKLLEPRG